MENRCSSYRPSSRIARWFEERLPLFSFMHSAFVVYPSPKNLNYWWTFGAILCVFLFAQIITGVVLAMHYVSDSTLAFMSVERIMRDVNYGWLLRYAHANGASMLFIAIYIHMFRALYYGSHKRPRELLWILGVCIYLLMVAIAFMGYVLPWGQMSFWGATVISNFVSVFPYIGEKLHMWLVGGFSVGGPTLTRFFSLHFFLPFVLAGCVILHIWALHVVGQNNPSGVDLKAKSDFVPFTPYATVKDAFAVVCFFLFFAIFLFWQPNALGHPDNYIEANSLVTPSHIVPEWYFMPFYAILRAVPSSFGGVCAMFGAILVLLFVPFLDTSRFRSAVHRPVYRFFFWVFVVDCFALGYLGSQPADGGFVLAARICTTLYFLYFLCILPVVSLLEEKKIITVIAVE